MADTPKMQALRNLSNQLPVANSRIAQGQQAARDIQLQNAVKSATPTTQIQPTAQQTAATAAQGQGQQMVEAAKQGLQQQGQVGQLGLGEQQQQSQQRLAGLSSGAAQSKMDNVQRLAQVSEDAKKQLFDDQMQFQKDEAGRTLFNQRQLADYAKANAQNDEAYKNYAAQAQQLSQKNLQAMDQAYKLVAEDLQNKYNQAKQAGDEATMRTIAQMRIDADKRIQDEKNKAANNNAMWQAGGTVLGAGAGALATGGSPQGAQVGASAGGALGALGGSQF